MKRVFVLGLAMVLVIACQKEDDTSSQGTFPKILPLTYMPLNVGNYWVYEHFRIDSMGNERSIEKFDSVIISRDTLIRNKKYFVLEGTNYPSKPSGEVRIIEMLRDSFGYLVNQHGSIRLAQYNFTDILSVKFEIQNDDTLYSIHSKMEQPDYPVNVPAGTYEALNFRGTLYNYLYEEPKKDWRYMNNYYAEGIGQIVHTWYYLSQNEYNERRLLRYRINE